MEPSDKVRENALRRRARRLGLILRKSRARRWSMDNRGQYRLIDADRNLIVAGERFECDLAATAEFLDRYESKLREPA